MFILVALSSCLAVAQASLLYDVYPQLPTYERAVGNYGYSDSGESDDNLRISFTTTGGVVASPAVAASPSVVYGGLGPYGLSGSGYNGYGLGYNGYGYRGVLGYSGLLGGYGGVIGLRK
ncbi:hypothetical protein CEXT_780291 [Caerostris extrusa]|uniref:Uncharacterized protein n=1 Tax=Caerostris extrusa TaxID=172846 RepID=A0AAV4S5M4_CAEEX|nr:hypothetical protein CEXT_780291 [Caerostris extrusa]